LRRLLQAPRWHAPSDRFLLPDVRSWWGPAGVDGGVFWDSDRCKVARWAPGSPVVGFLQPWVLASRVWP
jgi:hypothetical protein